jgi:glutamine cyclotransferase
LEYVDGFVYANVWTTFKIVKIDLASGNVVGEANLDDLLPKYAPEILNEPVDKGLNGIAYDSIGKRFFITGKYYPKIFEVKFN